MISGAFRQRVRGFRVVDVIALAVFLALAFGVYGFKTLAGSERNNIADTERQIALEQKRVRLLRAEIAHLEAPDRIERLSTQYLGLKPTDVKHEAAPDALPQIAAQGGKTAPAEAKP